MPSQQPTPNAPPGAQQQQPPQRPPSPWHLKFGSQTRSILNNPSETATHSGNAPRFPDLHPTYYAEDAAFFASLPPLPKPTAYQLDMLFGAETAQLRGNAGLTTWEAAVLNEHLVNNWPGGHRQLDPVIPRVLERAGEGVHVDEARWCPLFERRRWYDFRVEIVDGTFITQPPAGSARGDVWSVDVPAVWDEVSVATELADRWLREMAKGEWLNTLLWGDKTEWVEAEPGMVDRGDPTQVGPHGKPWRLLPVKGALYDAEKTLEQIGKLLEGKLVWTLVDDGHHLHDSVGNMDFYGRTVRNWNNGIEPKWTTPREKREKPFITIYLHLRPLRVLLNQHSTLAERCHARWSLAMTMLHELMHAINLARSIDHLDPPVVPYCGQEWDRELGCSGIQSFFGCDFLEAPFVNNPGKTGYKFGLGMTEFPSSGTYQPIESLNNAPLRYLGHTTTVSPLPAAWASSTLLESFYTNLVSKYGLSAFLAPRVLSSSSIYCGFYRLHTRARPLPTALNAVHAGILPQISRTLADLDVRRTLWARLRPWYPQAFRRWLDTPYANIDARAILARFAAACRLKDANEQRAEREAHFAVSSMTYWLTSYDPVPGRDREFPLSDWVFTVLAMMAQAVLPARTGAGWEYGWREVGNVWTPSRAAVAGGCDRWAFEPVRTVREKAERVYTLSDRHQVGHATQWDQDGNAVEFQDNRLYLLEQALECKQHYDAVNPLPVGLAEALDQELKSLFGQAGNYGENPKSIDEWLDWGFEFPVYSEDWTTVDANGTYVPWSEAVGGHGLAAPAQGGQVMAAQTGEKRPKSRDGTLRTRYFTVSEVGERVSEDPSGTNWALLADDHGGYDVFDVSDILRADPSVDTKKAFDWTDLGRQIVSQKLVKALRTKNQKPVGKLLTWKHPQDILERDGQDGCDLWCVIGKFVYDITDFPFQSEGEKAALLAITSHKLPRQKDLEDFNLVDLLERLSPYKCGFLRQSGTVRLKQRTFTLRELGRHIFPEIGMYCAIEDEVYDIGRYLHSHPGGAQILEKFAGCDATDEFYQAHADAPNTLKTHEGLKVGRIVDEISRTSDIDEYEIVLFDRVYRFSHLFAQDEQLFNDLQQYSGTDATDLLKAEDAPEALLRLRTKEELVCGKIASGTRRQITPEELQKHNDIPPKEARLQNPPAPGKNWRVWVSVAEGSSKKKMIYDVTTLMMFGGSDLEQKLRPWLGKEIKDAELADEFHSKYGSFIIGELGGKKKKGSDAVAAQKAQTWGYRNRHKRQSLAGTKRRVGALDDSDVEIMGRAKRFGPRGWR